MIINKIDQMTKKFSEGEVPKHFLTIRNFLKRVLKLVILPNSLACLDNENLKLNTVLITIVIPMKHHESMINDKPLIAFAIKKGQLILNSAEVVLSC